MINPFIRIQDLADILIMTFLVYQLYSWFRATRAMQVLFGIGVLTLLYFVTRFLGLHMTSWILQELGTVLIVLVIVVFQNEIRQALYRFSLVRHFFDSRRDEQVHSDFAGLAETLFALASQRTGAIVVFQRTDCLTDLALNGIRLECDISPQILESIFADGAPLHDGAILIRDGKIALASCHLPLSANPELPRYLGTRHRAAIGLTERCDAIVAVVSEERGEVSLAQGGVLKPCHSAHDLLEQLEHEITPRTETDHHPFRRALVSNLLPKTAVLLTVTAFWLMVTMRQGGITTVTAPVKIQGLPDDLVLLKSTPEQVNVKITSRSSLAPPPGKLDLTAEVDIGDIREGQTTVTIKPSNFTLPPGLTISEVNPPGIKITTEKKSRRIVPVRPALRGALPRGSAPGHVLKVDPATVEIEGPASQIARTEQILTTTIDASRIGRGTEYRAGLSAPASIRILREEPVTLTLTRRKGR